MPGAAVISRAPADDFAERAQAFAGLHAGRPVQDFVRNLDAQVEMVAVGDISIPVTVNAGNPGNAWICSPRATYADCAAEEAERYLFPWMIGGGRRLGRHVGNWLGAAGIDRAVAVNNWLVSTNLYPPLREVALPALVDAVRERWPSHAIWFRSLNPTDNADWIAALVASGFRLLVSRQVYLYEDMAALSQRHTNLNRDMRQLARTSLHRVRNQDIVSGDYDRIARLYELLYMEKYSRFNPHYSAAFMRHWHQAGLLKFHGFRDESGLLQCVAGLFRQGATFTTPIVGYDTTLPQSLGLYRLLTACACEAALEQGCRLNFSAGAAGFKRLRGGVPVLEYSAVDARHLPRRTRHAIDVLSVLSRRLGGPLLVRYGL